MRGASVNFQKIHSALHAVAHASRRVPPQYLLPPEHSLGTHVVIDDKGEVQKKLTEKMALASRQAKASKDYSPLWEGVINLPPPSKSITVEHQIQMVKTWCEQYEAITGHKVLRADIHLDEGYVDASGNPHYNGHAHVMSDRTDAAGKVIKLSPKQLREVQGMTAEVTQLERGQDARKTRRQHLNHYQFRFAAEQGRQQLEQTKTGYEHLLDDRMDVLKEQRGKVKSLGDDLAKARAEAAILKAQLLEEKALSEQYKAEREALKQSGVAKQADYQALKAQYEAAKAALTTAKAEAVEAKQEAAQAKAQAEAAQEQAQKATAVANRNYEVATAAKAQLAASKAELDQAKRELTRTTKALLQEGAARGALQAEMKRLESPKAPNQATPQHPPEKSLTERISASFEAMVNWIKAHGGKLREIDKRSGMGIGQIVHMDEHCCVQEQGLDAYCIHKLNELDRVPRKGELAEIQYQSGRGHVKPQDRGMDFGL